MEKNSELIIDNITIRKSSIKIIEKLNIDSNPYLKLYISIGGESINKIINCNNIDDSEIKYKKLTNILGGVCIL